MQTNEFRIVESKSKKRNNRRQQQKDLDNPEKNASDLFGRVEKCKQALRDNDVHLYASKVIYNLKQVLRTRFNQSKRLKLISYGNSMFPSFSL